MTADAYEVFNNRILRIFEAAGELFGSYAMPHFPDIPRTLYLPHLSLGLLTVLVAALAVALAGWFYRHLRCPCPQCQTLGWSVLPMGALCWFYVWFGISSLMLSGLEIGLGERLLWLVWLGLLGAAALVDARTRLLPNELTLAVLLLGLVWRSLDAGLASVHLPQANYVWGVLLGWGVPYCLNAMHERWRGHTAIGQGDAKLLAGLGAWLGMDALPVIWLVASGCVLVYTGSWWMVTRQWCSQVPFGPFLVMGASIAMLMSHV